MILGGSTMAMISLMKNLDSSKYQIDLQMQNNGGPLFDEIPRHVTILPEAQKYSGRLGRLVKLLRFCLQGGALRAFLVKIKSGRIGFSTPIVEDFWALHLSKPNCNYYDYAIGFLEGWSNRYLAYQVEAKHKYAWMHSTFENITKEPNLEVSWMKKVDKIVFVTDSCTRGFQKVLPDMAYKAITIENIIDSHNIKEKANIICPDDYQYITFSEAECLKIITVCRISLMVKGLDRIVAVAQKLKEEGVKFLWYIIGNGPDEEKLNSMIENLNVNDCLIPVGARFNPYIFIKEADVMCMPSRYEGKPLVVTESMILGTPPIVTEYLSSHNQIENYVEGVIVSNCETTVVDDLVKSIQNKEMIRKIKKCLAEREYGNKQYISEIERKIFKGDNFNEKKT